MPEYAVPSRWRFLAAAAGAAGVAAAPVREEPEQVVPLNTVVATCDGEGLLEAPWKLFVGDDRLGELVSPLEVGPSNLLLVAGADIEAAVRATRNTYIGGARADVLRLPGAAQRAARGEPEGGRVRLWAFFHFGAAQTSPVEWAVRRVAVRRGEVRATVARPEPGGRSVLDHRVYMAWAPLGEPREKAYTLQAYDETNRVVMMTRHVVIEA